MPYLVECFAFIKKYYPYLFALINSPIKVTGYTKQLINSGIIRTEENCASIFPYTSRGTEQRYWPIVARCVG